MVVNIPPDLQGFVDKLVESGRFESPSEVITAAVIALQQHEAMAELPEGALEAMYPDINELIEEGLEAVRAGRVSDGEEFFAELERELSQDLPPHHKTA
ncbi:MAG TPA: type II toxin-antitoxin system ParD family antitoxin [Tepidisphaeraceae bacterium]|jgi:putative addiction module CopG family antidote